MRIATVRDIAALVRDRRRARNWSQQALADRIGASRLWVSQLEAGKRSVQLDLVLRALAALDVVLDVPIGVETQLRGSSASLIRTLLDEA